jgi:uncharacterized MAPEG superfamily protein
MVDDAHDFRRQRRAGIAAIAVGAVVAVGLWIGITGYAPPLAGMETLGARMLFTLKCWALAILFCLVSGVEAVAHERLVSPAFDPLAGFETRRLRINKQYLQNTLEQAVVFTAAIFGLTAYSPSGSAMRAVVATAVIWVAGRFAFWIGYHRSAAMRGLGAPSMALSMLVLTYVAWRFGNELAGPVGGAIPVAAFVAIEAVLFWATRPAKASGP